MAFAANHPHGLTTPAPEVNVDIQGITVTVTHDGGLRGAASGLFKAMDWAGTLARPQEVPNAASGRAGILAACC